MQRKHWIPSFIILVALAVPGLCQARAQADVQVKSVNVIRNNNSLVCKVTVYSDHDDFARNTMLRILLPVGVIAISQSTGCQASLPVGDNTQGVVTCNLGDLRVADSKTVQITTALPPASVARKFMAFASSDTPDPDPSNNFRLGTLR